MVYRENKIGFLVIAYNEERLIIPTLMGTPDYVDKIFVVNDNSSDKTRELVQNYKVKKDERVVLINHKINKGPGGALITGYKKAYQHGMDVVVVAGGDHQFDLTEMHYFIDPIVEGKADYTKGNRFLVDAKEVMPIKRYTGNILLSLMTRWASGVHNIFDTQDGYTGLSRKVIGTVNWDLFWPGYGYPSDFIIKIAGYGFKIKDVPRRSIYLPSERQSQIKIFRYIFKVTPMIIKGYFWRLFGRKPRNKEDL